MTERECSQQQVSSVKGAASKGGEKRRNQTGAPDFWAEFETLVMTVDVCTPALSPSTTTSRKLLTPTPSRPRIALGNGISPCLTKKLSCHDLIYICSKGSETDSPCHPCRHYSFNP